MRREQRHPCSRLLDVLRPSGAVMLPVAHLTEYLLRPFAGRATLIGWSPWFERARKEI